MSRSIERLEPDAIEVTVTPQRVVVIETPTHRIEIIDPDEWGHGLHRLRSSIKTAIKRAIGH